MFDEAAMDLNSGIASSYAGNATMSNPLKINVSGSTYPSDATSPHPLTDIPNCTPASINVLTIRPTGVSIKSNLAIILLSESKYASFNTIQAFFFF